MTIWPEFSLAWFPPLDLYHPMFLIKLGLTISDKSWPDIWPPDRLKPGLCSGLLEGLQPSEKPFSSFSSSSSTWLEMTEMTAEGQKPDPGWPGSLPVPCKTQSGLCCLQGLGGAVFCSFSVQSTCWPWTWVPWPCNQAAFSHETVGNEAVCSSVKHPGAVNVVRCAVDIEQTFIVALQLLFRKVPNIFLKKINRRRSKQKLPCVYISMCGVNVYMWRGRGCRKFPALYINLFHLKWSMGHDICHVFEGAKIPVLVYNSPITPSTLKILSLWLTSAKADKPAKKTQLLLAKIDK